MQPQRPAGNYFNLQQNMWTSHRNRVLSEQNVCDPVRLDWTAPVLLLVRICRDHRVQVESSSDPVSTIILSPFGPPAFQEHKELCSINMKRSQLVLVQFHMFVCEWINNILLFLAHLQFWYLNCVSLMFWSNTGGLDRTWTLFRI